MTTQELQMLQALPLEIKIEKTKARIREWVYHWGKDNVYISFSGGKDSTVLLDLVRQEFPDVEAVFVDTGLEYPEIREFVKTIDNVEWLKPKMNFREVIDKYGYPVISKMQCLYISEYQNSNSEKLKNLRWNGTEKGNFKISEKWKFIVDAPFKVSDKCCDVMKKKPIFLYEKIHKSKPFIGTMASDSRRRQITYLQIGCNAFNKNKPSSQPLSFWTEQDILKYIKEFNLPYSTIYGEIIEEDGKLKTTGLDRTGCMFCMFGVHLEKGENRFQRMKETHPQIYDYCINKLGLKEVLDYIGVKY